MSIRRAVVIYNPRSSRFSEVDSHVLLPLKLLFPKNLAHYEILPTSFEDNVQKIAKLLKPNDIVIVAGGDGTAIITANAILATKHKNIAVGFLGFGNFNDIAGTFSRRSTTVHDLIIHHTNTTAAFPLDIRINKKHFRYALCYATFGFLAGAANEFEDKGKRQKLQQGRTSFLSSLFALLPYYLRNKGKNYLPASNLSDKNLTDYLAVNGPRMAKAFRTRAELYRAQHFHRGTLNVSRFIATSPFVIKSFLGHMPGRLVTSDEFTLDKTSDLPVQTDGEYRLLKSVKSVSITKSKTPLNIIKLP